MAVSINRGVNAFGLIAMRIDLDRQIHKLTFKPRDLNEMERASLVGVGDFFIAKRLPQRFQEFARTDLGYPEDSGKQKSPLSRALSSGLVQRLADREWRGWNPWQSATVPGPLWIWWIRLQQHEGRFQKSRTGYFKTARRELRQLVKADIKRRVEELSESGEKFEKRPLVETGDLERVALAGSSSKARVTESSSSLRISIPSPHPRVHASVDAVMHRITTEEISQMERVYGEGFERLVSGSDRRTIKRGPQAGTVQRFLTPEQRASIAGTKTPERAAPAGRASIA